MKQQENTQNTVPSLNGKKVVVLGGSSGIGFATAKAAAAEGAHVIITSSNQQRIDKALKQLPQSSKGYAADLTDEQQVAALFGKLGDIDHLVFTAGEHLKIATINEIGLEDARSFFNLRYWGAFLAVKYAAPHINANGSIVLTSGIASMRPPGKGWWLGTSICAAMEGFTRAMAVELAPIRVNIVSPGFVKTDLWSNIAEPERESLYDSVGNSLLVKRVGEAADLAQTYLYLMKQPFSTGQCIIVDGGGVLV